jgi:hypothetical protein
MAAFDADMERDEALDQHQRDRELIKQWLAPKHGRPQ